jgi:RNA polymerase sigma factor (sigma-70 family)
MSLEPIQHVIVAARRGDPAAIHDLLLRTQPDVSRFARSVCATPEDAEDAVQEALWYATRHLETLRVAAAFTSWVFQMVKHACFRVIRRRTRETAVLHLAEPSLEHTLPERTALACDVSAAIAALPASYRQVLIMRDLQGMTAPAVAASLAISVAAVKSRLHRARCMVRAALEGWAPAAEDAQPAPSP